ncbi:MAG: YchJ family protein [Piscirickettsiaceae bacterium]|nr:YchJ family protein [Piscirickettsiaceae bacterium]
MEISLNCPCCSNSSYQACCQPLLDGELDASSAEQLMRSRYSAFCLGKVNYLIDTLHPDKRQLDDVATLKQSIKETQWLGLKIIRHKTQNQEATVEFIGFYQDKPIGQLHERSRFVKQDKQWFYVDGEILPPIKLARNEQCFCGSGRKFKKCHATD